LVSIEITHIYFGSLLPFLPTLPLPLPKIMRAFVLTACLLAVASAFPSKLQRQSRQGYISPQAEYGNAGEESQVVEARAVASPAQPIAILRSSQDGPLPTFRYSYETENEITNSAEGELRLVDDTEVMVMRGSYSYVGPDGNIYQVDWYADETGFHPSAPHLPKSVEPNHPEVAAAVRAQIAFAEEEEAAASRQSNSYASPDDLSSYNRI